MTTIGVLGGVTRATVGPDGTIAMEDGRSLRWHVAADDRWHTPATSPTLRQHRPDGTPVVETRLRIPSGDAVHRAYASADGDVIVVEIENDSPLPFAVAFEGIRVGGTRPAADVPIRGIDLPRDAQLFPVGHRATLRVAVGAALPSRVPSADDVSRGWRTVAERASRLDLPDRALSDGVIAARCALLLGDVPDPQTNPAAFVVACGELVRMGEPVDPLVPELAAAVERAARAGQGWATIVALAAAERVLAAAGETRALKDLARVRERVHAGPAPQEAPRGAVLVPWVETLLAADGTLFPRGIPAAWHGADFEVRRVPIGPATTISFAVRWHGSRPAVLWELDGERVALRSPASQGWTSSAAAGEALFSEHGHAHV